MGKKIFDRLVSLMAIIVLSPFFLIVALLVLFVDRSAPFFLQKRVGFQGKLFTMYKFRTMNKTPHSKTNDFDAGNRDRITSLGRFLRKTKLDEIPQLINVLLGDMSLVGPRPEVLKWTKMYTSQWKIIHSVLPGITDYASLTFYNEEILLSTQHDPDKYYKEVILPQKLSLNVHYINNRSFYIDIKIIINTIRRIFSH